jgi:hypothetical protein
VPVALLDPSYVRHFAGTHVARLGEGARHEAPFWYYLAWLPAMTLPWTLFAPAAALGHRAGPSTRALVLWAAFVPAVLTVPRGKLAPYALSALVPLSLLLGPPLGVAARDAVGPRMATALRAAGAAGTALLAAGLPGVLVAARFFPLSATHAALLAALLGAWAVGLGWASFRARAGLVPAVALGATLTVYAGVVHVVAPAVARLYSDRDAAALVVRTGPAPVVAWSALAPSLAFYLRSPVLWTEDPALVRDLFARDEPVFLVTGRRHFDRIEALLGARAHVWHATRRRRLYANRPPPTADGTPP